MSRIAIKFLHQALPAEETTDILEVPQIDPSPFEQPPNGCRQKFPFKKLRVKEIKMLT
jgi:hypothetical protein